MWVYFQPTKNGDPQLDFYRVLVMCNVSRVCMIVSTQASNRKTRHPDSTPPEQREFQSLRWKSIHCINIKSLLRRFYRWRAQQWIRLNLTNSCPCR